MDQNILFIIIGISASVIGIVAGKFIFSKNTKRQIEEAEERAKFILTEAKSSAELLKKEKLLEAKEHFVKLKSDHDMDINERNRKLNDLENRTRQKELTINQKTEQAEKQIKENETIKTNLNRQIDLVNIKRTELEKHQEEHTRRLEKIAGLTADEAKKQLIESLKHEAQSQAVAIQKRYYRRS